MVSEKILIERKKRNWTQTELAKRSGIAQPLIAKYEKGHMPSAKNLDKLASAFGLSPTFFTESFIKKGPIDVEFNEIEFEKKMKEIKKCSVKHKQALEKMMDLILDMRTVEMNLELSRKIFS